MLEIFQNNQHIYSLRTGETLFIDALVPETGEYQNILVIEVLAQIGDLVEKEQSILSLESDKATMDVPTSQRSCL